MVVSRHRETLYVGSDPGFGVASGLPPREAFPHDRLVQRDSERLEDPVVVFGQSHDFRTTL
jgi:hypothetical protein